MSQTSSYYLYQKYEKRGEQDWIPYYPNTYSVDADGTMPLVVKTENDPACGYVPSGQTIYRWVNLNPATDYYCLECGTDALKVSGTYGSGDTFAVNCNSSTTLSRSEISDISGMTFAKIGSCIMEIGDNAFGGRPVLSGVSIPSTVETIGNGSFSSCTALVDCALPESVTTIGNGAFMNCITLSNIMLWNTVTSIGSYAFGGCDSIISINIPTGLTSIPEYCFSDCGALSEVIFPNGVTSIGQFAFYKCSGLVSITCLATVPPTLGDNVFLDTNNCPIYVPAASVNAYKSASGWSSYADRIQAITS